MDGTGIASHTCPDSRIEALLEAIKFYETRIVVVVIEDAYVPSLDAYTIQLLDNLPGDYALTQLVRSKSNITDPYNITNASSISDIQPADIRSPLSQ